MSNDIKINNKFDDQSRINIEKGLDHCVEKIHELPSFPSIAIRALSLSLEEVDLDVIASIIESDPGITLKILNRANSASRSVSRKVSNMAHALSLIGLTDLQCILLSNLSVDLLSENSKRVVPYQKKLMSHSLACAVFAELVSKGTYPELAQDCFAAGILHDIGKIGMMLCDPINFIKAFQTGGEEGNTIKSEQSVFSYDHVTLGKRLAEKWDLPETLTNIIYYHHLNISSLKSLRFLKQDLEKFYIIKLANTLSHEFFVQGNISREEYREKEILIKELSLTDKEIGGIEQAFLKVYSKKAEIFNLEGDLEQIYISTIGKANKKLASLTLGISHQRRVLKKHLDLQKFLNEIGMSLSLTRSVKQAFEEIAQAFTKYNLFKAGLIYILDRENWILEGQIWHKEKNSRSIRCFLDRQGRPVWDQQTSKFPSVLKELFSSYKNRIYMERNKPIDCGSISYKSPFYTIPLCSKKIKIEGELCLAPHDINYRFSETETLVLSQVVKLIVACLENLRLIERLEKKNEELTFALWKNQQLQKKILHTERLAIAGQLAAGAAHEINNPLAVINARAQLLQLKETDPVKQKHLMQITEQIERISNILSRLMDFARPAPPTLISVNIHHLLDKVLEFIEPGLKKYNISLKKDYEDNLPEVKADPNQLEQVFLNLIINAQHAMEESGGTLLVKTSYNSGEKKVYVEIIDQGCGIPERQLKNIFDPFFTTKAPGKGTGLGLSISSSIIENHYGKLEITSKEKVGTNVKIILPINIEELRDLDSFSSMVHTQENFNARPHILIVDDEKHIQEILSETLEAENMDTTCCSNGAEALELIDKKRFDIILLDMKMPILDGLSLINAIKKRDIKVPIIIITGMASHEEIKEAMSKGVYKCIKKPFHIKPLIKNIKDVLRQEGFFEELPI